MKYDAITLDTNIFTNNGYALEHGLLGQLAQFKQGSVKFILSEIVAREISRHITQENTEIRAKLDNAISRAKNKKLLKEATADTIIKLTKEELSPAAIAEARLKTFILNTGLEVIKANSADMGKLVELYFSYAAPFENKEDKKHEFPDAIALLSLEQYAQEKKLKILAVSKDKGWLKFANSSEWIDVDNDFTNALALLQSHADEAKNLVATFLKDIDAFLQGTDPNKSNDVFNVINAAIEEGVSALEPHAEADSYLRAEAEYSADVHCNDFSLLNATTFSVVQIGKDYVVAEVPIKVYANASAEFGFYIYDSIDKDETYMGSKYVEKKIEFKAAILITLEIDSSSDSQTIELMDVELIKGIDSVNFGEIEPNYEPDYDDE